MHLKSSLQASRWGLAFLILVAAAGTVTPAFAQLTKIAITAPNSQTVTCPANAPGGAPCVNLTHGQTVQFSINYTGVAPFDPTITWSFGPTLGTLSSAGLFTAPASLFQTTAITITATSGVTGVAPATATVYLIPTVGISITPTTATLTDGQTVNFQAPVSGTQSVAVTWSIPANSPGTIQDTGIQSISGVFVATATYTAPVPVTGRSSVIVTAVSVAAPNQQATATVSLVPAAQVGVTVSPQTASLHGGETQQFSAAVVGLSSTAVTWTVACAPTTPAGLPQTCTANLGQFSGSLYIAPQSVPYTQTVTVTATSTANSSFSGTAAVTLLPPTITVSPSSVTLSTNQVQQFAAMINGVPYTNVTWSLSSSFGTIDQKGNYTAPSFATAKLVIQVIATDNADPTGTHTGTATVTINQSAATITPSSVSLAVGGPNASTQQFTFNIDGVADMNPAADVQWSLSVNIGTISATGLYTAPASITAGTTVTLTGTYLLDASKTAKATISLSLYSDVGHGAPNAAIQELFITNFYRNNFNNLVSLPPLGDVKKLGATGYVQEFADANKTSGVKYALVKPNASTVPNANGTPLVFQLYGDVYGYYTSVTQATAGYPTEDSQNCPYFDPINTCTYDLFDKPAALFVYKLPVFAAQTQFIVSGVFYTKWNTLGGLSGLGRPVDAVVTGIASPTTNTATVQLYSNGGIYQITKGPNNAQVFAVVGNTYTLYTAQGGPTGYLGLPTADELVLASGDHRQTFEGGAIQYTPGSGPVVRLPVASVSLGTFSGTQSMTAGATMTLTASAYTAGGAALTDRPFTWSTSNGQVAVVAGTSGTSNSIATIKAVGSGTASIRVSADGIVSLPLNLSVTSPCCQVGEGAPTQVITQAFQSAVTRDHLNVALPAQNPVQRVGHGYVQQLQDATQGSSVIYLIAKSDNSPAAYVVTGAILTRYQSAQLGGPAGVLGYPTADPTAGGTQTFENSAALAGSPVVLVSGAIFTKWSGMGFETGAAGVPVAEATTFKTVGANAGNQQSFQNGVIFAATSGPRAGQSYFVGSLILAAYNAAGGPGGAYGMPTSDEFVSGTDHRQNFEGGYIDYNTGDTSATVHPISQKPSVTAPPTVLAGSRAHLAVTGFQAGDTIQVAVTGQPTFTIAVPNGAYSWDVYVPLTAKAATITVQASDPATTDSATATYSVLSLANNRATFTKVLGDVQSGMPGAMLPQPITVALLDQSGNPVIGAPVTFQASPGAQILLASSVTDSNGHAQAGLRLPAAQGLAAVTVDSPGIASSPVIFYATAASSSLASFPKLTQTLTTPLGNGTATIAQKGALLVASASIIRYYQNNNVLPAPNGLADPATMNQFLKAFCTTDNQGRQICDGFLVNPDSGEQVVNLWRLGEFVSGGLDIVPANTDLNSIRDLVAAGSPVLLSLSIQGDTAQPGGHYVVAIGVGPNGEVLIQDPNPLLAAPQLDNYLNGFVADGHNWTGKVLTALKLAPQAPLTTRFLLQAISQPPALLQNLTLQVNSVAGACGQPLDFTDAIDASAALPATPQRVSRFVYCDGSQALYQVDVGTTQPYRASLTDFAKGGTSTDLSGSAPASYQASRPGQWLVLAPQGLALLSSGVVNGASFTPGIAPGGIFTIFGSGLSAAGSASAVTINGESAQVLLATPFQINAQVPSDLAPASYTLQVQSPFGSATQQVAVSTTAPAIFLQASATQGAIFNQDGTVNSDTNPTVRGQSVVIYCTGLGAVTEQGNLSAATIPVTVVLPGSTLTPSFAGLTPGSVGVYQVNLTLPGGMPPGLDLPMSLSQGGTTSNSVAFSVQ